MTKYFFLLLIVLSLSCNAGWFDKKLELYACSIYSGGSEVVSEQDAIACSNACKPQSKEFSSFVEFKINRNDNIILRTNTLSSGKLQAVLSTEFLKDCTIFDENNWECKQQFFRPGRSDFYLDKMMNGKFYSYGKTTNLYTNSITVTSSWCAK